MMETIHADWLLTPGKPPQAGGGVHINRASGQIDAMDSHAAIPQGGTTFLTPGLINTHTHLELYTETPIPLEAGETMADWILKVVAVSHEMTESDRMDACGKSLAEMLATGTTCVNDITATGASLAVLSAMGVRGIVSPEFFHPFHTHPPEVSSIIGRFQQLQTQYADPSLLSLGISPHSPYNVTAKAWEAVLQAIEPNLLHTHLAETLAEVTWFRDGASPLDCVHERLLKSRFGPSRSGITSAESVEALMSPRWIAAHGVYLSDPDIVRLQRADVALAHCPRSNFWISGETMDYHRLKAAGLRIGLGTDSRFSCPSLDLREEARTARMQHGLSAVETFELLTSESAKALHLDQRIGFLEVGYEADMVLWRHPAEGLSDPYEAWLAPETTVEAIWVRGQHLRTASRVSFG